MTTSQTISKDSARLGYASGIVVSVLLPIALFLFGIASPVRTLSLIFLFAGVWTILFGSFYRREKFYWIGWGAGVAVLASIAILPLSYTVGLVLVVIVVLILATAFGRRAATTLSPTRT